MNLPVRTERKKNAPDHELVAAFQKARMVWMAFDQTKRANCPPVRVMFGAPEGMAAKAVQGITTDMRQIDKRVEHLVMGSEGHSWVSGG